MLTTLTNTTFLVVCVALIACLVRYATRGENDASVWMRDVARRLGGSKLLVGVLLAGGLLGVASHVLAGYPGAGDLFQDFVGAKEFAAGGSLNPPNMQARVDYWLSQEHLESSLSNWAPVRRLQATSIHNTVSLHAVQGHPPFHILLIAPLVALCGSIQRFDIALTLISFAAYAWLLLLLWRSTNLPAIIPAGAVTLLAVLALDWQPLLANLREGQIQTVVALLVIAGWYALTRDRPWSAGILIGLATLIKMFPGVLLFWLLLRRRRAFLAALCTISVAVLFLYLVRGQQAFIDYLNTVRSYEDHYGRGRANYSLSSVIPYVLAGGSAKSLWASAAVALADVILFGYSAFLSLRKRTLTAMDEAVEFSGYMVLCLLLSPAVEAFYYPFLLLPMATLATAVRPGTILRGSIALLGILWCFSSPDQVVWLPTQLLAPMLGERLSFLLCSFPTFGMLALWYWITQRQRGAAN